MAITRSGAVTKVAVRRSGHRLVVLVASHQIQIDRLRWYETELRVGGQKVITAEHGLTLRSSWLRGWLLVELKVLSQGGQTFGSGSSRLLVHEHGGRVEAVLGRARPVTSVVDHQGRQLHGVG